MRGLSGELGPPSRRARNGRPLLLTGGAVFFGLLGAAAAFEALRGTPLPLGGPTVASPGEALLYRVCAALTCLALSGWLLLAQRPERRIDDGRLR